VKSIALYSLAALALAFLVFKGLQNQPDPEWAYFNSTMQDAPLELRYAQDSMVVLHENLHRKKTSKEHVTALLSTPFMPTMTYEKMRNYFQLFSKKQFSIISSITGTGATTISSRIARLIATKPDNLLEVACAPQFDLILHEKFVGKEENGVFQKGKMLQMWDACFAHPEENFMMVVDNFSKINPETFFGPELWEKLDNPRYNLILGSDTIRIPNNFHFLAVIHTGASARIELNNEHFNRLGGLTLLHPEPRELLMYWSDKKKELEAENPNNEAYTALSDTANLQRFVYLFSKTNSFIRENYGPSYQLGQWNNLRKLYKPGDEKKMQDIFLQHVNSLKPARPFTEKDFDDINYTLANNGLAPRTSFLARQVKYLQDTGYFVEITMVGGTALLTAFFGWWFYRRREKVLRLYGQRTNSIFKQFDDHEIGPKEAAIEINKIKEEVDGLVLNRKLNYTEALYFLAFIDDKLRNIEFTMQVSETFLELVNTFLDDDILTKSEYNKLSNFLSSIQYKMPQEKYKHFRNQLDELYLKYREE